MFCIYFYRRSASGELPVLHAVSTPSIGTACAILVALRAIGHQARLFGKGGKLFATV